MPIPYPLSMQRKCRRRYRRRPRRRLRLQRPQTTRLPRNRRLSLPLRSRLKRILRRWVQPCRHALRCRDRPTTRVPAILRLLSVKAGPELFCCWSRSIRLVAWNRFQSVAHRGLQFLTGRLTGRFGFGVSSRQCAMAGGLRAKSICRFASTCQRRPMTCGTPPRMKNKTSVKPCS